VTALHIHVSRGPVSAHVSPNEIELELEYNIPCCVRVTSRIPDNLQVGLERSERSELKDIPSLQTVFVLARHWFQHRGRAAPNEAGTEVVIQIREEA